LLLQVLDCEHTGEDGVSIIGTASSVKEFSTDDGVAWSKAFIPAFHPWLLVEMAVHHHVLGVATLGIDDVDDQR